MEIKIPECDLCDKTAEWIIFGRLPPPVVLTINSCRDHLIEMLEFAKNQGDVHEFIMMSAESAKEVIDDSPQSHAERN